MGAGTFGEFFKALHDGCEPYDWQTRLAESTVAGEWPDYIDLPTGAGKTACLDIAVYALARQAELPSAERRAPRRLFFCVNRRVIVDEAYRRSLDIAKKLADAEGNPGPLGQVAAALRRIAGEGSNPTAPALDVLQLRGGAYRDNRWARSVTQPTIVTTTVDQLGSRLLFRGYGVSNSAAPIQAALIAYDSLVLLDEAHISRPFSQTLKGVGGYLSKEWNEQPIDVAPMRVVPMTATPPADGAEGFALTLEDRGNKGLARRLEALKPAELVATKNAKDTVGKAIERAKKLAEGDTPTAVAVMVNRVATARAIHAELRKKLGEAFPLELVIGSMRPIDRDAQTERINGFLDRREGGHTPHASIVVSTQCLEVGADYDFDVLVTECASLDALRQRFGRLNRGGRLIEARATILSGGAKKDDPIYGDAQKATWDWLHERKNDDGVVDFGIDAFNNLLRSEGEAAVIPPELLAPSAHADAPVMLPVYVDFWRQTSPRPTPDPDVGLFLHGPERTATDVRVCWRADLDEGAQEEWADIVSLVPPTSPECLSVPIGRLKRWLAGERLEDDKPDRAIETDLLGVTATDDAPIASSSVQRAAVLWRGREGSEALQSLKDLRPGDTLVLPAAAGGWDVLGHVPDATEQTIDVAEQAYSLANHRALLRLHPSTRPLWGAPEPDGDVEPAAEAIRALMDYATADPEEHATSDQGLLELLAAAADTIGDEDWKERFCRLADQDSQKLWIDRYPPKGGKPQGLVLRTKNRLGEQNALPALDDGEDDPSRSRDPVSLEDHVRHVVKFLKQTLGTLPLGDVADALERAAELHDDGKADPRFQAYLQGKPRTARDLNSPFAKSGGVRRARWEDRVARERAGLPEGFRHELLSLQLAERRDDLPDDPHLRDLVLHLVASHHGHAAPFVPVVVDPELPGLRIGGTELSAADRAGAVPPHRLDSGVVDRFWRLVRRHGWWGLSYLEATLRLADQQASAAEDRS
ncbi:helicase Cas3 [Posidoniimonas corsicana]|uniref:Helicase Cas3 n=1 Tax=Posidoniimonas corsicana TaxID=1938618 RepID=A0A5C5UUC0_9BACT|nr:type I-U CRISPR-associated helicase/endonuclease Cas3 [Posidoniimonas corsicana]TWT29173.1 helicase Cas3 [Posidoniimonas corsicana]